MDMNQFNKAEQAHLQQVLERKQMMEFMRLYSGIAERCFNACAQDFTSKVLTSNETTCVTNCATKFLKFSERVNKEFAEVSSGE